MSAPKGRKLGWEFPLLKRELIGLLRTRRAFWLLVLTLCFSSLLPLLNWPSSTMQGAYAYQNLAVLSFFFLTQLTAALLTIPAFTAGAISGERERETYGLLYSTLLSPASIVLSKAFASMGYVLILLIASAPSVCVLYLLGGIRFQTIMMCYLVTFAAVVTSGLVCLAQSMRSRRTAHAAVRGVVWVAFWNGGLALLLLLAFSVLNAVAGGIFVWGPAGGGIPFSSVAEVASLLSPFSAISISLFSASFSRAGGIFVWGLPWYFVYAGALSAGHLIYLLMKVRTPEISLSRRRERRLAAREGRGKRRAIRRSIFTRALLALGEAGFPLLRNPVFLKEIRSEFFARIWYRRLAFWGPLAIFISIAVIAYHDKFVKLKELAGVIGSVALSLIILLVPAVAAGAFPREMEQGNLDFLRGTLLSFREILHGKFLAGIYGWVGMPAAAGWVLLASTAFFSEKTPPPNPAWILTVSAAVILMTLTFTTALATLASVVSKRSLWALVISYLAVLAVFLLWPMVLLFSQVHEDSIYGVTSPFAAIFLTETFRRETRQKVVLGCFLALYGAACALLYLVSWWALARFRARDR